MKVFVFLTKGFEEIEAIAPIDLLRRAGLDLKIVSIDNDINVEGAHGLTVKADMLFDSNESYEGLLILAGGPGYTRLLEHEGLKNLLIAQNEKNGKIAAICAAPSVLANLGILDGKNATVFPGFEDSFKNANYLDKRVVQDKNILTAKGPAIAIDFALEIIKWIISEEKMNETKDEIQYNAK